MKSMWNGSISFGLVNIPIKLYSAIESKAISFRMLHKEHHTPIHYKRWCDKCEAEVEWDDIEKGIEIDKNQYYVITKEELEELKPKKTDQIEIVEFVDSKQIDPIYFDKHYFMGPTSKNEKPYFLLKEILQNSAKMAIGIFVMREKEHVCAIESYKDGLLLTTLNYAYEIRDISQIDNISDAPKLKKEEIQLAKELTEKLYKDKFDIGKFKDTFSEELEKLLKKKAKGEPITITKKTHKTIKEKDLVEALKASLK